MRWIAIAWVVVAGCRGDEAKPRAQPPPNSAPPGDAALAAPPPDARVIAPRQPMTLACPPGSRQVTGSVPLHGADARATALTCEDAAGRRAGPFAEFDETGELAETGSYAADQLDGEVTAYRHGVKSQTGHYTAGAMTGTWRSYYDNGKLDCESIREADATIALTCYAENGHLIVRGKSPGGVDEGLWEWFHHDDGTPSVATLYKHGEEVKNWIWKGGKKIEATSEQARGVSDYAHPEK